ncbi:TlpA disulfide reductase family protein [Flavobacterium flavipallidum]|uniref:TlpA disulfide reductase family protein n=1 Tax=Flavobacterium flavipallidum TaxID=3139140 RepID=A0ABU9HIT4_9FLAO
MKNKIKAILLFVLSLSLSFTYAQKSKNYAIAGKLEGLAEGTKVALMPFSKYSQKNEIETTVQKGQFAFKGQVPEPRLYFLVIGNNEGYYQIMIENAKISINGKVEKIASKNENPSRYTFSDIKIVGSKSNDYYYSQIAFRKKLDELYQSNQTRYKDVSALIAKARSEKNNKKMDSILQLDTYKEYAKAEKDFFTTVQKEFDKAFEANKQTYWGPLMMLSLYSYLTPEQRPTFDGMSKEAKESYYGKMTEELLYPANKIGQKVHAFTTADANGNKHSLAELIKGKKVVLIDFWASWCKPCRAELPNVKANYEKYASKGFDVISISIDKDSNAWKKALEDEKMKWPNFNDNDVASLYKVVAVPTTYLIDGEGKLIADNVRGEDLGKKLQEIFGF